MKIQQVVEAVQASFGRDISVYTPSFLRRCINERMKSNDVSSFGNYVDFLHEDQQEIEQLLCSMWINYTLFFRSPLDVALLEEFIFPGLIQSKEHLNSPSIRVWSAGCASGAEAYSLAILHDLVASKRAATIPVLVFGTDISPAAIEKAHQAVYDRDVMVNTKLSWLERYFVSRGRQYTLAPEWKGAVDFSVGDISDRQFTSPPGSIFADFDIVSCCNLLIYYNPEVQKRIVEKLGRSMVQNGYLVVDQSERSIIEGAGGFRAVSSFGNIFTRI
jgi:chemotaxis methyl-accepting protein methylase